MFRSFFASKAAGFAPLVNHNEPAKFSRLRASNCLAWFQWGCSTVSPGGCIPHGRQLLCVVVGVSSFQTHQGYVKFSGLHGLQAERSLPPETSCTVYITFSSNVPKLDTLYNISASLFQDFHFQRLHEWGQPLTFPFMSGGQKFSRSGVFRKARHGPFMQ